MELGIINGIERLTGTVYSPSAACKYSILNQSTKRTTQQAKAKALHVYIIRVGSKGNTRFAAIAKELNLTRYAAGKAFNRACKELERNPVENLYISNLIEQFRRGGGIEEEQAQTGNQAALTLSH